MVQSIRNSKHRFIPFNFGIWRNHIRNHFGFFVVRLDKNIAYVESSVSNGAIKGDRLAIFVQSTEDFRKFASFNYVKRSLPWLSHFKQIYFDLQWIESFRSPTFALYSSLTLTASTQTAWVFRAGIVMQFRLDYWIPGRPFWHGFRANENVLPMFVIYKSLECNLQVLGM